MAAARDRMPWPERLVRFSRVRPRAVLSAWLAIVAAFAFAAVDLRIDTSTSSFLDRSDPAWQTYQRSLERFGGDEFIVVALEAEEAWQRAAVAEVVRLSDELAEVPGVRRVDSLATVGLVRNGPEDDVRTDAGLAKGLPADEAAWQRFIRDVRSDRIARASLVSSDERVFALNLLLDTNVDADRAESVAAVRDIVATSNARVTGVPIFRTAVNERTQSELLLFVPLTLLLLAGVVLLAVRSLIGVVIPLLIGCVAALGALGAMGALGVTLSLTTMILPSMLLAMGCAYAMHSVTRNGDSLEEIASPVALSGATTAIGIAVMATVPIAAIQQLAGFGALGVAIATAATLSLAPALLVLRPIEAESTPFNAWLQRVWLPRLLALCERRELVIGVWVALLVVTGVGIGRLQVSTDIIQWFPHGSSIRDDYETVRAQLSGITPVNVVIDAADDTARDVMEPDVLSRIDALSAALQERDAVGKTLSVADPLRMLRRALAEDGQDRLPATRAENEQNLLLLFGVERLDDVLPIDRRSANILIRMDDNASQSIVALSDWVGAWWRKHGTPDHEVTTTGVMYEFARAEEAIAHGQIRGLALAALAIGFVLIAVLRAPWVAFASLCTNLVPLAIGFGGMGLLGIPLDAATVCLGSVALGIAVDDTVHVATGFQAEMARGADAEAALRVALRGVLPALVLTTLAISIGFAVLALSGFTLIRNLGVVTAVLVSLCLVADLTLLPALLRQKGREEARAEAAASA